MTTELGAAESRLAAQRAFAEHEHHRLVFRDPSDLSNPVVANAFAQFERGWDARAAIAEAQQGEPCEHYESNWYTSGRVQTDYGTRWKPRKSPGCQHCGFSSQAHDALALIRSEQIPAQETRARAAAVPAAEVGKEGT